MWFKIFCYILSRVWMSKIFCSWVTVIEKSSILFVPCHLDLNVGYAHRRIFRLSRDIGPRHFPWRCYPCGSWHEAANLHTRRLRCLTRRCDICCEWLDVSPPPYNYMRNMKHKHSFMVRCNRCLHGRIPELASCLRQTCKHWRDLASGTGNCRVLFLVIGNLSKACLASSYPWKCNSVLHDIVLSFGHEFVQRCESTSNAQNSFQSLTFSSTCGEREFEAYEMNAYRM